MLRSYRHVIFAFGLIFCLTDLGQAQEQTQHTQGQTATEQQPAQTLPIPLPVEIVEDEAEAEARQRSEAEARQREKDDLVAQQGMNAATQAMNEATQDMAFYSLLSTILVGIGTVLLIATLLLTLQANRAAQTAVDVTRQIGEAQIRAYLYCKSARFKRSKDQITATVELENTGQSPASSITIIGTVTIQEVGGEPKRPRVLDWIASSEQTFTCQPITSNGSTNEDMTFYWEYSFPERREHSDATFNEYGNELIVEMSVNWSDVFRQRHDFTAYLHASIGPSPYNSKKRISRTGKMDVLMSDPRLAIGGVASD